MFRCWWSFFLHKYGTGLVFLPADIRHFTITVSGLPWCSKGFRMNTSATLHSGGPIVSRTHHLFGDHEPADGIHNHQGTAGMIGTKLLVIRHKPGGTKRQIKPLRRFRPCNQGYSTAASGGHHRIIQQGILVRIQDQRNESCLCGRGVDAHYISNPGHGDGGRKKF